MPDINSAIQWRHIVDLKLKSKIQSFVIESMIEQCEACYLIIDVKHKFNVLKAFDQCFKVIQVLMIEYLYETRGA